MRKILLKDDMAENIISKTKNILKVKEKPQARINIPSYLVCYILYVDI